MTRKYLKVSDIIEKWQIKPILSASIMGFIGGSTTFFLFYDIPMPPIGIILCPIYPVVTAYMILRHKLFGINIIIRKGLAYSILIGFITSFLFASMLIIEKSFQGLIGYQSLFITIITGFIIALSFNPLKNQIQKFVDRRFFRGTMEEIAEENERLRHEMLKQDRMKAVATLAAGMAHEIKNPLTVIKTFSEYLPKKHQDSNFITKFTALVTPQVERINNTVQQLLNLSKIPAPDLKQINVSNSINQILEMLSGVFISKRIRVESKVNGNEDVIISADPEQLKQVFLNLFLNSIDSMPQEGALKVSADLISSNNNSLKSNGGFAEVRIQDTGCGISEECLKHLFEPFFTTKPKGTGLGLSIVRDILEQHKAKIAVESKENQGTSVIIRFPTKNYG